MNKIFLTLSLIVLLAVACDKTHQTAIPEYQWVDLYKQFQSYNSGVKGTVYILQGDKEVVWNYTSPIQVKKDAADKDPIAMGMVNEVGQFNIKLPPGSYTLSTHSKSSGSWYDVSQKVKVEENKFTEVKFLIDKIESRPMP